jgi:hypothetical protein
MKTVRETQFKQPAPKWPLLLAGSGISAIAILCAVPAAAEEARPVNDSAAAEAVSAASQSPALSPGVAEILKLADAGVSPDIVVTFVESFPSAPQLTGKDIIAMKEHNVPDEVVKLVLKRGASARVAATKARNEAILSVVESRRLASGGVDPESYDYFRAYYLQPRAMASANHRLYPHFGRYSPRGYPHRSGYGNGVPVYRGFR